MAPTREKIKKDVVDYLYSDARVDAADVLVEVRDGMVVLRGTVPTLIARHYAAVDALAVEGVRGLENQLNVRYPSSTIVPSDEQIRSNIESLLAWTSHIDSEHIRVHVHDGIVSLDGSVDALWKKPGVEEVLVQLTGVTAIENKLAVVPTKDVSDETVAELVANSFARNPLVNADAIQVRVANAVVTLTGAVSNWTVREAAYHSALNTFGVIGVDDRLVVAESM